MDCREQEVTSSGQSVDAGSEVMDSSNNWEFKDGKVLKYKNYIHVPTFPHVLEILTGFARASSSQIFLVMNQSLLYGCYGISSANKT